MIRIKNMCKPNLIQMIQVTSKKTIEIRSMITVVRATFHNYKKYYPQVLLD